MVRILQIVDKLNMNGTESLLMTIFRNLDKRKVMFDFLVTERTGSDFEKEALELGANIFTHKARRKGLKAHISSLHDFYRKHAAEFGGVHLNGNSFSGIMPLVVAKEYGVPVRVAHCHNMSTSGIHNRLLHLYNRRRIPTIATHFFACSEGAREYGFKGTSAFDKAIVVTNGIELDKFRFNKAIRDEVRQELNIGDNFVIGNVAGFRKAKNHAFMLEVLKEVLKLRSDARLMLIGDGELLPDIKSMARRMNIESHIDFLGSRNDVARLLQGMDSFLFPSFYEGLGISLIEAQAAGLPTITSSAIPKETDVTPLIHYLPLDLPAEKWAHTIVTNTDNDRGTVYESLNTFDIKKTCELLTDIYLQTL